MTDLGGRVALVTGAGSGIGRASALAMARAGATVVFADIDGDAANATAAESGHGSAEQLDVTDARAVDAVVARTVERHGALDVLVCVAGVMHDSHVADTTDEDVSRVWAVNFLGTFFACRAAARVMARQGRGSIVTTASAAVDVAAPGLACYSTSKAAVVQLTRTLAAELGPSGVRANVVAPGYVVTPMTARRYTDDDGNIDEERRAATLKLMAGVAPLRRTGEPEDIAHAVLFLASDESSFVTGQILRVNGGASMPW